MTARCWWTGRWTSSARSGRCRRPTAHPGSPSKARIVDGTTVYAGGGFTRANDHGVLHLDAHYVAMWDGAHWSPIGVGGPGLNSAVDSILVDGTDVYIGGRFTNASNAGVNLPSADYIARWDGSVWTALGAGMGGEVYALTRLSNGDLIAGGLFITAGGITVNHVARWNGSVWSPLGSGEERRVIRRP